MNISLVRLRFERFLSHNGRSISQNVASLNLIVQLLLKKYEIVVDCNWTRTHNHLVHKRTLNHLAKLAMNSYFYGSIIELGWQLISLYINILHSVIMKIPLLCLSLPLTFQILANLLRPPTSTLNALFDALFLWQNGWSHHMWCVILLNDVMNLLMSSLGTLVPEGPCCVFYTRPQVYWRLTGVFLIDITHTNKDRSTRRKE